MTISAQTQIRTQKIEQKKKGKQDIFILKLDSAAKEQRKQTDTMDRLIQAINDKEKKEKKKK